MRCIEIALWLSCHHHGLRLTLTWDVLKSNTDVGKSDKLTLTWDVLKFSLSVSFLPSVED